MSRLKLSKYNDGFVLIYKEKAKRNEFAAKENVSVLDDLDFLVRLDFEQSAKRQEDVEFAEQQGFALSMKIKTRYRNNVNSKCKAIIGSYLYDVAYVDDDRRDMWLYLQGVREIASNN